MIKEFLTNNRDLEMTWDKHVTYESNWMDVSREELMNTTYGILYHMIQDGRLRYSSGVALYEWSCPEYEHTMWLEDVADIAPDNWVQTGRETFYGSSY